MSTFTTGHLMPRSVIRYRPSDQRKLVLPLGMPRRASRVSANTKKPHTTGCSSLMRKQLYISSRLHWVVLLGSAMLATWLLLLGLQQAWIVSRVLADDLSYGRLRVTETLAFVGHEAAGEPSRFLALNVGREVHILEFPGGDSSRSRLYIGPKIIGEGTELLPVLLSFADRNADSKLDMIVQVGEIERWYRNEEGGFVLQE